MVGTLQPLDKKFAIVDKYGNPTDYFVRWAQQKQIDITGAIQLSDLVAYLDAHKIIAGVGIQFAPGPNGDINQSPTIHADVQAILDEISATRGIIIYRGIGGWAALLPGTAGNVLQTNGAGADPTWVAPSGGGGGSQPVVRNTRVQAVTGAASTVVSWPVGTVAGDVVVMMATQDNTVNLPAGWRQFDNQAGSFIGGIICAKVMTPTDIATGSVTVNFSSVGNGGVCLATIDGTTVKGVRGFTATRSGAGAATVAMSSTVGFSKNDLVLVLGGNRASSNNTVSNCTSFGTSLNTNQSIFFGSYSGGSLLLFSETFSFSVAGSGYYVAIIGLF